ncbi:MAG: hypothetical protein K6G47_13355 [Clostridia bacterium]|nr:hypothetical protein [Clostridia bacterium]
MKTLIVILLTILIVLLLSASATFIYYLIYRKAINKRIESGLGNNTKKRRFLNPLLFFIIVTATLLLLSFGVLMFTSVNPSKSAVRTPVFEKLDDDGTAILFDENTTIPGYERSVIDETDSFKIVVYKRKESSSSFPNYLIHIGSTSDYELAFSFVNDKVVTDGSSEKSNSGWYSVDRNRSKGTMEFYVKNSEEELSFTIELR